ncbi:MAG: glycosyltransferase [Aurantibacter sp.]
MDRFTDSLLIIIVIYNRALEACESFQSVLGMRAGNAPLNVFVYDNSPISQQIKSYDGLRITYFHDPENSGVSRAYNVGVRHAENAEEEWVLLLDQDTRLPNSILENYQQAINKNQNLNLFVPVLKLKNDKIFSPSRYRYKRGFYLDSIKAGKHSLFRLAPVNSGIMVKVAAFLEIGGYNEKVKLDFSDFQFVERFRKQHPDFYAMDVECMQDFSDDDSSFESQSVRFKYFCEGARNIEGKSIWDWLQYNAVVFIRAFRLSLRFGKPSFIGTYFKKFLFAP